MHAGRTRRVGGNALGRDGRRRAARGQRVRAGAGARPVRPRGGDVERRSERELTGCGRQLCGVPAPPLARLLRLEPEHDVRDADEPHALALLLAGLHAHRRRPARRRREPRRGRRDRRRQNRRIARGDALRRSELRADQPAAASSARRARRSRTRRSGSRSRSARSAPQGVSAVPAKVQAFAGAQWGRVRTFAPAAAHPAHEPAASRHPVRGGVQAGRDRGHPGHAQKGTRAPALVSAGVEPNRERGGARRPRAATSTCTSRSTARSTTPPSPRGARSARTRPRARSR